MLAMSCYAATIVYKTGRKLEKAVYWSSLMSPLVFDFNNDVLFETINVSPLTFKNHEI